MTPPDDPSRRRFIQLMSAVVALAGAGCFEATERRIVPYSRQPPEVTPGVPRSYATTMTLDGYGTGLLAESREGRPVKIEGNPEHPASLGAAGVFEQASVLGLYDPYRARHARRERGASSWSEMRAAFGGVRPDGGAGLRFLLEPTASPLRSHLLDTVAERHPRARVYFHSAVASAAPLDAARRLFGRALVPRYQLDRAAVVAIFGADLLASGPYGLRYARDWARARAGKPPKEAARMYVAEPAPTPTGTLADHRLPAGVREIEAIVGALYDIVSARGDVPPAAGLPPAQEAWVRALAGDLRAHRGGSVVVVGPELPEPVHVLAGALNAVLGNEGRTVHYAAPVVRAAGEEAHDVSRLAAELRDGAVDTLVILEANAAFTTPAALGMREAIGRAGERFYLGLYEDETAEACNWFIPATHYLESWGDARAYDGTISTVQPLIAPLYGGRTADEVLAVFAGVSGDGHELLRDAWRSAGGPEQQRAARADPAWRETLRGGVLPGTAAPEIGVRADLGAVPRQRSRAAAVRETLEVVFRADARVHDGRYAQNPWLLELPDAITKLTWDNAALVSPEMAARKGVSLGDVVELAVGGETIRMPVLPVPGHAEDVATVSLGYGRRRIEGPGAGLGVDAYRIRPRDASFSADGTLTPVREPRFDPLRRTAGVAVRQELALAQVEWSAHGRDLAMRQTFEEFSRRAQELAQQRERAPSFYDPPHPQGAEEQGAEQWAMTIDLGACTGCSACVVACQAENNVPVVGKEGVARGRLMHWLRIDRYVEEDGAYSHQPMLCQHCEKAPCEYVCPVNATVHSADGLNEMVYNRCVGTRFCSNNCPYKVRRFNWLDYGAGRSALEALVLNPDVTVRERGVMEKCTYCVQRIRRAEIVARREGRGLRDGEVVTACQQACPTQAIVFGSLTHEGSAIVRSRADDRQYAVLNDLATQPRTRYLVRVTNPNPELVTWTPAPKRET